MHEPENFLKLVNSFKLGFLCKEGDLKFSRVNLLGSFDRLPGVLLELGNGGVQRVRLPLQGLHLLPDRIHRGALLEKRYKNMQWGDANHKLFGCKTIQNIWDEIPFK